jgi:hypothetical protein
MLGRPTIVAALGTTQTLAWASSYYLVAILADPTAEELDLTRATVFGIFSASLLLAAVLGPAVGLRADADIPDACSGPGPDPGMVGPKGTWPGGQPRPSARQPYHTQGTRRYLTLCIYSAYPGKTLRRNFSSSRMRQTSTGKNGTTRKTLHHEPSASGIAKSRSNAPEYIGCRTYAYGPVDTTGCPSSTRMVDAA